VSFWRHYFSISPYSSCPLAFFLLFSLFLMPFGTLSPFLLIPHALWHSFSISPYSSCPFALFLHFSLFLMPFGTLSPFLLIPHALWCYFPALLGSALPLFPFTVAIRVAALYCLGLRLNLSLSAGHSELYFGCDTFRNTGHCFRKSSFVCVCVCVL
jgi:hypothetical protein